MRSDNIACFIFLLLLYHATSTHDDRNSPFCGEMDGYADLKCDGLEQKRAPSDGHVVESLDECCAENCYSHFNSGGCPVGQISRDKYDFHQPSSRDIPLCIHECVTKCLESNSTQEATCVCFGECPRDECSPPESDEINLLVKRGCQGQVQFKANECCHVDRRCSVQHDQKTFTCDAGEVPSADEHCDSHHGEIGEEKLSCERCCVEGSAYCMTNAAKDCTACSHVAPCQGSIDPHCVSNAAAAAGCLECDTVHDVSNCSMCAPGLDPNCHAREIHAAADCSDRPRFVSVSPYDGTCFLDDGNYRRIQMLVTEQGDSLNYTVDAGCKNSDCTECYSVNKAVILRAAIKDIWACKAEDDVFLLETSLLVFDEAGKPLPTMVCPDAGPCGPAACTPGTDAKCVVFTAFEGEGVECSALSLANYTTVGTYHAFATADGTCRTDSGGRSYYKLTGHSGDGAITGKIGCKDTQCSIGCADVNILVDTCSTPAWSNKVSVAVTTNPEDFSSTDTGGSGFLDDGSGASLLMASGIVTFATMVLALW